MTHIAQKLAHIKPSQTKAISQMAAALKGQGREIISLSLGEPDFNTPENIIEAGARAMHEGHTRYTLVAGMLPLREQVVEKLSKDNHLSYEPDQITIGTGAKQVLYNAMVATLDPGDEVIIPTPCWVSYPEMVSLAGGVPVLVESRRENGYMLDPREVEARITPRTKWIVINSPCNPTGVVYPDDQFKALAEVLRRHPQVFVLSDDVYEKLVYPGVIFTTMAKAAPDLTDRCLVVNSFSKAYCMTGWRIGYGAGPAPLVKAMNLVQSQTTSHASSISQVAAIEALQGPQDYIPRFVEHFHQRTQFIVEKVNQIDGMDCLMPQGAFYAFLDCSGFIGRTSPQGKTISNDIDLGMYFMESANVAVVPGSAFLAENHLRISCATSMDNLVEALKRIEAACRQLN